MSSNHIQKEGTHTSLTSSEILHTVTPVFVALEQDTLLDAEPTALNTPRESSSSPALTAPSAGAIPPIPHSTPTSTPNVHRAPSTNTLTLPQGTRETIRAQEAAMKASVEQSASEPLPPPIVLNTGTGTLSTEICAQFSGISSCDSFAEGQPRDMCTRCTSR
jgi:hypothetical protein